MPKRYQAKGMRLVGAFYEGEFRILFGPEDDSSGEQLQVLGSGPSLVEALDSALQMAIVAEEDWRKRLGR